MYVYFCFHANPWFSDLGRFLFFLVTVTRLPVTRLSVTGDSTPCFWDQGRFFFPEELEFRVLNDLVNLGCTCIFSSRHPLFFGSEAFSLLLLLMLFFFGGVA